MLGNSITLFSLKVFCSSQTKNEATPLRGNLIHFCLSNASFNCSGLPASVITLVVPGSRRNGIKKRAPGSAGALVYVLRRHYLCPAQKA
jgi:hypothetical protein